MQLGDPVKVTGTVKDLVTDKATGLVSVMMQTEDLPGAPGREMWFPEAVVQANPLETPPTP
jgi:pyruvate carboxylase